MLPKNRRDLAYHLAFRFGDQKFKRSLKTSKAREAARLARKCVEPYLRRNSPHKFTQQQLMTRLVLRAYLKTTYWGHIEILETSEPPRRRVGLQRMPHYSTLKKFADRLSVLEIVDAMLSDVVAQFAGEGDENMAIDSTGLETTDASTHLKARST